MLSIPIKTFKMSLITTERYFRDFIWNQGPSKLCYTRVRMVRPYLWGLIKITEMQDWETWNQDKFLDWIKDYDPETRSLFLN